MWDLKSPESGPWQIMSTRIAENMGVEHSSLAVNQDG